MPRARTRASARGARAESADLATGLGQITTALTASSSVRHDRPVAPGPTGFRLSVGSRFLVSDAKSAAAVRKRSEIPIRCALGPNGSGKTLLAVRDLLPSLDAGRTVYSTVPLLDHETGLPHPSYVPFVRWQQFLDADNADFLADEISAIAASRDHNNLHSEIINRMHQLRKVRNTFTWTAPSWRRADLALREVTWSVTECQGFLADRSTGGLWAPNRLFVARTYSMRDFDEWSAGKRATVTADLKEWFNGVGSRAFASYDTYAAVDKIEGYDPRACEHCGKPRRVQYCGGHESR